MDGWINLIENKRSSIQPSAIVASDRPGNPFPVPDVGEICSPNTLYRSDTLLCGIRYPANVRQGTDFPDDRISPLGLLYATLLMLLCSPAPNTYNLDPLHHPLSRLHPPLDLVDTHIPLTGGQCIINLSKLQQPDPEIVWHIKPFCQSVSQGAE